MKRWAGGLAAALMLLRAGDSRADDGVIVHLRGSPDVKLEMRGQDRKWQVVCDAPCGGRFARDGVYRLRGDSLSGSEDVELAEAGGDVGEVEIAIEQRHSTKRSTGRKLLLGGVAGTVLSIGVFVGGVLVVRSSNYGCYGPCDSSAELGILMLGFGAANFVAGSVLSVIGGIVWSTASSTAPQPAVYPKAPAPPPVAPIVSFAW